MEAHVDRPFVYVNMAMSADGKITTAAREYPKMTSRRDRDTMDRLRAEADAVLIGAGTLRADHPHLHVRSKEMQKHRSKLGKERGLVKVIVTGSGNVDPESRSLRDPDDGGIVIATTDGASHPHLDALAKRGQVWRLGASRVDLIRLLNRLKSEGVDRLLVEGGGELNADFFDQDLIDEYNVTLAPTILAGRDAPTPVEGGGFAMKDQRRLKLASMERHEDEIYLRWRVLRSDETRE